jgi:hypothetical protein
LRDGFCERRRCAGSDLQIALRIITKGFEAWIVYLGKESDNVSPVGILLLACRGISGEEFAFFFAGENSKLPSFSIDSVFVLSPLARELKKGFRSGFSRRVEIADDYSRFSR